MSNKIFSGGEMNFKIIKIYINVCRLIEVNPSFNGLQKFEKYYYWECGYNGNGKNRLGKDANRYV